MRLTKYDPDIGYYTDTDIETSRNNTTNEIVFIGEAIDKLAEYENLTDTINYFLKFDTNK